MERVGFKPAAEGIDYSNYCHHEISCKCRWIGSVLTCQLNKWDLATHRTSGQMPQSGLGQSFTDEKWLPRNWPQSQQPSPAASMEWQTRAATHACHRRNQESQVVGMEVGLSHSEQNFFPLYHASRMHKLKSLGLICHDKTGWEDIRQYWTLWQKVTCWQPSFLRVELLVLFWLLTQAPWVGRDRQIGTVTSYTSASGVHKAQLTEPSHQVS